jgi:hypothetical protein
MPYRPADIDIAHAVAYSLAQALNAGAVQDANAVEGVCVAISRADGQTTASSVAAATALKDPRAAVASALLQSVLSDTQTAAHRRLLVKALRCLDEIMRNGLDTDQNRSLH